VVECDLAKVEVAGSNPVSRSNFAHRCRRVGELRLGKPGGDWRTGNLDAPNDCSVYASRTLSPLVIDAADSSCSLRSTEFPTGAVAKW
jgi:hypothetical protein